MTRKNSLHQVYFLPSALNQRYVLNRLIEIQHGLTAIKAVDPYLNGLGFQNRIFKIFQPNFAKLPTENALKLLFMEGCLVGWPVA